MKRSATLAFLSLFLCLSAFAGAEDEAAWSCATEMSGANPARIFAQQVVKRAEHAFADPDRAVQVARAFADGNFEGFRVPTYDAAPFPDRSVPMMEAIRFLLVVSAIDYRYGTDDGLAEYSDATARGSDLLTRRVAEHWETLRDPLTLARITVADLERIFGADVPLPDLASRQKHLNEVGAYLLTTPDCGHDTWLQKHKTPVALAIHLARTIPGFREPLLTRAQIFVGRVIGRYRAEPGFPTSFTNAGELTSSANAYLPTVLYRMGIVRIAPELEAKLRRGTALEPNSREEVELRAATVVAMDALDQALRASGKFDDASVLSLELGFATATSMPAGVFVRQAIRAPRTTTNAH